MRRFSTAVRITDPLVKYQSLVATGVYSPDPAQHRLARHLHKIYLRIKDYSPQAEYRQRLRDVARLTEPNKTEDDVDERDILARRSHSIWRNPLFKHLLSTPEGKESLALTRILKNHETAIEIDSPKGLFLSGEVGTGKSMLLDLLADGLPTERKKRWHFNTFMLYTLSALESHRKAHAHPSSNEAEYSLLWMAKKLVDESPILFLDEFQLPDRAASKLLSHLFIAFFQLGGVLVASSNRMPEELQRATGVDYAPAPSRGLIRRMFGAARAGGRELYGSSSDFANFLDVLKARCDFWQMDGAQDWRRVEEGDIPEVPRRDVGHAGSPATDAQDAAVKDVHAGKRPRKYHLYEDDAESWKAAIEAAASRTDSSPIPWEPSTLIVYGRRVQTPQHYKGVVLWDFDDLVETFGPADYITMASSYHTFIIDNLPVLTVLKKNEARRFITLLDALYEARCKLVIRAQSPPDDLFFPESKPLHTESSLSPGKSADKASDSNEVDDATYSETIAEVYQDQISPFRPNVSYYDTQSGTSKYDPDQDSDFGLPLHKDHNSKSSSSKSAVDFSNTGAFTGEDERFAYKRAASRLWELCSAQWHTRAAGGDWWRPLPAEARHWEGGPVSRRPDAEAARGSVVQGTGEGVGESVEVEERGLSRWRVDFLRKQSKEEEASR